MYTIKNKNNIKDNSIIYKVDLLLLFCSKITVCFSSIEIVKKSLSSIRQSFSCLLDKWIEKYTKHLAPFLHIFSIQTANLRLKH